MASHLDFTLTKEEAEFAATHVRLAYSEAHKFSRRTNIPYDDLIGAAHIGLCKAAKRFDPSRGFKVSTYAVSLIRGELLHFCRDQSYLIRISHRFRELWMKGRKHIPYGRSDAFIAKELGVELSEWLECRHICSGPPLQLNETVHDVQAPGYHGKPQIVEDDRTATYVDAVRMSWENQPKKAAQMFWGCSGMGRSSDRRSSLEAIVEMAIDILDGNPIVVVDPINETLAAASCEGPDAELSLTFEEEDLGNGRVQPSVFS